MSEFWNNYNPHELLRWGILWRYENKLDGKREHLYYSRGCPLLFETRREAQAWKNANFGYIAARKDLREEPYGWKIPKVVRVKVTYELQAAVKKLEK